MSRGRDMLAHDTFALPEPAVVGLVAESVRIVRGEALERACVVARRALARLDAMGQAGDVTREREAMRAMRVVFEMVTRGDGDEGPYQGDEDNEERRRREGESQ